MPDEPLLPGHPSERVRDPELRTMETDISTFLKSTKPTLLSIAAMEGGVAAHHERQQRTHVVFSALAIALIMVIAILIAVFIWGRRIPEIIAPVPPPIPPPAAFLFFENIQDFTVGAATPELWAVFPEAARWPRPENSFTRIIIGVRRENAAPAAMSARQFFETLGANPPGDLLRATEPLPQWFLYHQAAGPRLGMTLAVKDETLALRALDLWEPTLERDLAVLLMGASATGTATAWHPASFSNIEYRWRALDPDRDIGIGALYFPAKRRIIMATSEESLRAVIARLLDER
ncbi:MAG: hypothetical protein A3A44_01715 [Candidatus Sungbacteria bacterium RIFCSPLOWO2_01_FULL_60_25]|uniref:Uncharacterized protein n=1 Tax=Candidatus Sungbacteria bacterium RIFCSPLOWO2_01_FULL_60_25 TaxID=1802281 RepID=A0A1G2LET6_9BACT|nr:MAG: hypothetical protein A3A44_01715 [Candidatus Sungbacteria bacterium RIFCSPLOWO2_01_FULL_60_25]